MIALYDYCELQSSLTKYPFRHYIGSIISSLSLHAHK